MKPTKLIALLPDLASFILIVDEGSFTAAAKILDVTPSALSKLVTRLETSLSVKLFDNAQIDHHSLGAADLRSSAYHA